jgi:hypothetical protein
MLFVFLAIFFGFIFLMDGDVEQKRIRKEKDDWKRIMGRDYK